MKNNNKTKSPMKEFAVFVEKRTISTGSVRIKSRNADEAWKKVNRLIDSGELQTAHVKWNPPEYEDFSFKTTEQVEKLTPY